MWLFAAVIVTVSVLLRAPCAIVSVVPVCVKSVFAPGAADTVSVACFAAFDSIDAVTVATPPSSEIELGDADSRTSLSATVTDTVVGDNAW